MIGGFRERVGGLQGWGSEGRKGRQMRQGVREGKERKTPEARSEGGEWGISNRGGRGRGRGIRTPTEVEGAREKKEDILTVMHMCPGVRWPRQGRWMSAGCFVQKEEVTSLFEFGRGMLNLEPA
ncbi:hypothetical protein Ancab_034246 [Ancistrocladus abbreviatus]